jgi:anti-anti-sigma regulatory factor
MRMPFSKPKGRCEMFRACYSGTADTQRWTLHGRLAAPWVDELRSCWKRARERAPSARVIVDLKEVTFIDQAGQKLLAEMRGAGARLVATGVEHQHLIAMLDHHTGQGGNK